MKIKMQSIKMFLKNRNIMQTNKAQMKKQKVLIKILDTSNLVTNTDFSKKIEEVDYSYVTFLV